MGALGGLVSRRLGWDNGGSGSRDAGSLGGCSGGSSKGTGGSVRAFAGVVTLLTTVQAAAISKALGPNLRGDLGATGGGEVHGSRVSARRSRWRGRGPRVTGIRGRGRVGLVLVAAEALVHTPYAGGEGINGVI